MLLFKYAVKMNERLCHIIRLIYRNTKHDQKEYPKRLYSHLTGGLIKWQKKTKDCIKILMTAIVVVFLFNKIRLTKQFKTCHYDSMTV